ncbi:unnamed protein product [Peronospora belbahrii]|uniref:BZIP domain-containing protein n=1 Tax=Peronospora belbahrii TaxID=622444 RepID=A0AAU9KVS6_9STRA|nr:unnamed protein product [Peronospora belbahrii]
MNSQKTYYSTKKYRTCLNDDSPPTALKFMSNSERGKYYRRRRKQYGAHLEERVNTLRNEIAALEVSRQVQLELTLSQRQTPLGAAASIVKEYCLLFNHGAPVQMAVDEHDVSASLVAHASTAQRGFLQAVMNTDVQFGDFCGIEPLLGQWERYSLYHAAIEWTMKSLEVIELAEPEELVLNKYCEESRLMISINADLRVKFSRRTIEEVFPHLAGDEVLTQMLIGLEVTYPCMNHFCFDPNGKIEWYTPEVDFVGALTRALKHPELVARVMGSALIRKDHLIGDECDGRELGSVKEVKFERCKRFSAVSREVWSDVDGTSATWARKLESTSGSPFGRCDRLNLAYILAE